MYTIYAADNRSQQMLWSCCTSLPTSHALLIAASPFGMSANLRPSLGERSPGHLKYSGTMYPIAANIEILKGQQKKSNDQYNYHHLSMLYNDLLLILSSFSICAHTHRHIVYVYICHHMSSFRYCVRVPWYQKLWSTCVGSCRASAQPHVCAWRQRHRRRRRDPRGPKNPQAAAPLDKRNNSAGPNGIRYRIQRGSTIRNTACDL